MTQVLQTHRRRRGQAGEQTRHLPALTEIHPPRRQRGSPLQAGAPPQPPQPQSFAVKLCASPPLRARLPPGSRSAALRSGQVKGVARGRPGRAGRTGAGRGGRLRPGRRGGWACLGACFLTLRAACFLTRRSAAAQPWGAGCFTSGRRQQTDRGRLGMFSPWGMGVARGESLLRLLRVYRGASPSRGRRGGKGLSLTGPALEGLLPTEMEGCGLFQELGALERPPEVQWKPITPLSRYCARERSAKEATFLLTTLPSFAPPLHSHHTRNREFRAYLLN